MLATDKIGVDSTTGVISIDSTLSAGSYTLFIKGLLQNGLNAY